MHACVRALLQIKAHPVLHGWPLVVYFFFVCFLSFVYQSTSSSRLRVNRRFACAPCKASEQQQQRQKNTVLRPYLTYMARSIPIPEDRRCRPLLAGAFQDQARSVKFFIFYVLFFSSCQCHLFLSSSPCGVPDDGLAKDALGGLRRILHSSRASHPCRAGMHAIHSARRTPSLSTHTPLLFHYRISRRCG